jgi:hypothetical protein
MRKSEYAPEDKVQCRLLLDIVVVKSTTILKLLACEDQTLLVRRDSAEIISERNITANVRHTPPYPGFLP